MSIHRILCAVVLGASVASAQVTTEQRPLPAAAGWNAAQIHTGDGGVWYARVAKVAAAYGAPEAIVTDDKGQLTVLSVYSGKWTARSVKPDGGWLAPSAPADVDPRVDGPEIYAAGKHGNVHRVTVQTGPFGNWRLDSVEIGHAAGEEFHTVVAADLDPSRPGAELLAFAISGDVYRLQPEATEQTFTMRRVATIEGRVRDAVVMPARDGSSSWIAGVSRSGHLLAMRLGKSGLERHVLARESMGLGRIASRGGRGGRGDVLYVTRDDGVVLRFSSPSEPAAATEGNGHGSTWQREIIFAGPQGLRGIVAGRFHADPSRESVMVYGYGQKVQHVSRSRGGRWEVETVFVGEHRGHWLTVGEFDGRNATDEVIATGFGGQVILFSRPPGHGLDAAVAVDGDLKGGAIRAESSARRGTPERPWRIAVKGSEEALRELSPLNYQGGFETKSMIYETLVRRDDKGRIAPALAASWQLAADGRSFTFTLREGATFHDGTPVTADDVAVHFKRWVGLPEHAWLRCNERIIRVEALGPRRLRITLDRPHALLPDLCAINPTAIRGPGALNREGAHRRPIGSGPFAFVESLEQGRVLRYRRHRTGHAEASPEFVDLVRLNKTPQDDPIDALLRGEVDAILGSWLVHVDPARACGLRKDPRFKVLTAPGSSMVYVGFRLDGGPTANRELRRRIAAAVDRDELVRVVEHGLADPSTGWAAPSVEIWPQRKPATPASPTGNPALERPLCLLPGRRGSTLLAETLAAQLQRAGLPTEVVSSRRQRGRSRRRGGKPTWDLRIEVTHGVPYDPYTTAVSRFTPPANQRNAESVRFSRMDARITALMGKAMATPDDEARYKVYAEVQKLLDEEVVVLPLYAPRRIAVLRNGMPAPVLDHDMYGLDASWLTDSK